MNIEYLHYFLDVTRTNSITRAAKLNFISPQGMSRAMSELEKELNCELFVRKANKLTLSEKGQALVPVAKSVVDDYALLTKRAEVLGSDSNARSSEPFQLMCQRICGLSFIPRETIEHLASHSDELQYREADNDDIIRTLRQHSSENKGKRDAANMHREVGVLCIFDTEKEENFEGIHSLEELGYRYIPYLRTFDRVVVGASSPLAKKGSLTEEDIKSARIVTSASHLHESIAERFGEDHIILTSGEHEFRKKFVDRGLAVSFMPAISEFFFEDTGASLQMDFEGTYQVEIGFIGTPSNLASQEFQGFVESLDSFFVTRAPSPLFELLSHEAS